MAVVGICRLCASLRKADQLETITDPNDEICRKLHVCCNVVIRMGDSMPKCICLDCIQSLHAAFVFYTKVHESQESLAMLFPAKTPSVVDSSESIQPTLAESLVALQLKKKIETQVCKQTEITVEHTEEVAIEEDTIEEDTIEEHTIEEHTIEEHTIEEVSNEDDATKNDFFIQVYEMLDDLKNPNDLPQTKEDNSDNDMLIFEKFINVKDTSSVTVYDEDGAKSCHDIVKLDEEDSKIDLPVEDNDQLAEEYLDNLPFSITPLTEWSSYMWLCCLCDHTATSFLALQEHTHLLHENPSLAGDHTSQPTEMQYKCSDCQKTFTRYSSFLNHVRQRHHPALSLCCDVCDERCVDHKHLAQHRQCECAAAAASYPEVELCNVCGKGFLNQNGVQLHLTTQHSQIEKSFECEHCGKQFKRSSTLRAHMKVHSDVKEFTCDLCGHEFRQRINLDVHLLSHLSDKPFECTICKKSFKTPVILEKHILTHTDVKQFKCDYCDNLFRTKDSKLSHERTHTGEMPFKCGYCERRFRFRSTFTTHINLHTGERPYSCSECERTFTNWSNYNKHMKRMHHSSDSKAKANSKRLKPQTKSKLTKTKVTTANKEALETTNCYYLNNDNGEIMETVDESVNYESVYDEFMDTSSIVEDSQRGSPFEGFEQISDST